MSLDASRWAWMRRGLSLAEKIVLLALADRADEADSCYPSVATIAEDTGANRKTVMAALLKIEARGLIVVRRVNGAGNRYHLVGVEHRTSPKNGTGTSFGTGPKNGTAPVPKTGPLPVPKTGHEPTNEPTNNRKRARTRFSAPSPDEVAAYAKSIGYPLDGHRFCDHYDAVGWRIGNKPMKDWKAAVRTWRSRDKEQAPKPAQKKTTRLVI